jgi:hypothetical protein
MHSPGFLDFVVVRRWLVRGVLYGVARVDVFKRYKSDSML